MHLPTCPLIHGSMHTRCSAPSCSYKQYNVTRLAAPRQQRALTVCGSARRQKDNPLTIGAVSALTESLRAIGVGKERFEEVVESTSQARPLRRGDVNGVISRLRADYKRAYFVTGTIDDSIYEPDCYFADPTIAFTGLQLWKRNLQLLVPFLVDPTIDLFSIKSGPPTNDGRKTIKAEWQLRTVIKLPWRPLVDIGGSTEYILNEDGHRIEEHIESWKVSGTRAILQLLNIR